MAIKVELPPARANYQAIQRVNGQSRKVHSDGTNYYDITSGKTLISNPWIPYQVAMFIDFDNNRGWWGGATKTVADLTAIGDGTHTLPYASVGGSWTGNYTVLLEYEMANAAGTTGKLFGYRNSNVSLGWAQVGGGLSGSTYRYFPNWIVNPNDTSSYALRASIFDPNGADLTTGRGRMRAIWSVPSSALSKSKGSGGLLETGISLNGVFAAPTGNLHFLRDPADGTAASGITLHKVGLWHFAMTEAEMLATINATEYRPIHILGDSFANGGLIREAIRDILDAGGLGVVPTSQDGIGSTSMSQQLTRFLSRPEAWSYTLVWLDGALELTGLQAIDCIAAARAKLTNGRFLYTQSNPIHGVGDSRRTDWDLYDGQILTYLTAARVCNTLNAYLAAGDGSPEDNADIALLKWPRSKCPDGTHPVDTAFHAQIMYDRLAALRWLP